MQGHVAKTRLHHQNATDNCSTMIAALHLRIRAYRKRWKSPRRGETELSILPLLVQPGTAIDVGANKGTYSYFLSKYCDRVIAYEANPDLVRILQSYRLKGLDVRPFALSDHTGEATLFIPLSDKGTRRNNVAGLDQQGLSADEVKVPCKRLDDEGLTGISFIKIDVEGHELAVLHGSEKTILRDRPTLLIEINGGPDTVNAGKVFALLDTWDYIVLQHFRGKLMHYSQIPDSRRKPWHRNYICMPRRAR